MVNAKKTQLILEKFFSDCVKFWMTDKQSETNGDEREAFKRALENDLIGIYKHNANTLHDPFSPRGEELDKDTVLKFFEYRCMDLYGKEWKEHYKGYGLE